MPDVNIEENGIDDTAMQLLSESYHADQDTPHHSLIIADGINSQRHHNGRSSNGYHKHNQSNGYLTNGNTTNGISTTTNGISTTTNGISTSTNGIILSHSTSKHCQDMLSSQTLL